MNRVAITGVIGFVLFVMFAAAAMDFVSNSTALGVIGMIGAGLFGLALSLAQKSDEKRHDAVTRKRESTGRSRQDVRATSTSFARQSITSSPLQAATPRLTPNPHHSRRTSPTTRSYARICADESSERSHDPESPFRLVHLDQGSPSWLRWRRSGIGASDAAAIMGVSPWSSVTDVISEKGGFADGRDTPAMARGRALESTARAACADHLGTSLTPICVESVECPWLRASLDGLSDDRRTVVEIKCPGARDHASALKGLVPTHYKPQLQHILAVTGLDAIYYWSYRDGCGTCICVQRDEEYIQRLVATERLVWLRVSKTE